MGGERNNLDGILRKSILVYEPDIYVECTPRGYIAQNERRIGTLHTPSAKLALQMLAPYAAAGIYKTVEECAHYEASTADTGLPLEAIQIMYSVGVREKQIKELEILGLEGKDINEEEEDDTKRDWFEGEKQFDDMMYKDKKPFVIRLAIENGENGNVNVFLAQRMDYRAAQGFNVPETYDGFRYDPKVALIDVQDFYKDRLTTFKKEIIRARYRQSNMVREEILGFSEGTPFYQAVTEAINIIETNPYPEVLDLILDGRVDAIMAEIKRHSEQQREKP